MEMETMDNKLTITIETGEKKTINVLDIIDSYTFNKTFMIFNLEDDSSRLFAGILNEKETSYSVDPVTDSTELEYLNKEIERVINEIQTAAE